MGFHCTLQTVADVADILAGPNPKKRRRTAIEDSRNLTEVFPARVTGPWKIGVHISAAGGGASRMQSRMPHASGRYVPLSLQEVDSKAKGGPNRIGCMDVVERLIHTIM